MSPLAQKLLEITRSEKESKYWGLSTQARKKIERLIEEHDPRWETFPEEFDILIRDRTVDGIRAARAVVLGHEDEVSGEGGYPTQALMALNISVWRHRNDRDRRCDAALRRVRLALRRSAGVPSWALRMPRWVTGRWVTKDMRDEMNDLVAHVCKEMPEASYEQIADEVERRWEV